MNVVTSIRSPNFSDLVIPVEFVVVHFTAASLERTLEIFTNTATEVSAHLVIDRDGSVYELVECLGGTTKRGWHAGRSRFEAMSDPERVLVEGFNDRSIGIELVNLNGNIFPYTEAQYAALFGVIELLKGLYPALNRPEAVLGHEQIAGFRGKCDPGRLFEWERLFSVCYPGQGAPERPALCSEPLAARLRDLVAGLGVVYDDATGAVTLPSYLPNSFFSMLSALSEAALSKEDTGG